MILFVSCKTAAEIQREQMMKSLSVQMVEGQRMTAEGTVRLQVMEDRINQLSGQIEESHKAKDDKKSEEIQKIKEELLVLQKSNEESTKSIATMQTQLTEMQDYMKKLMGSLTKLTGDKKSKKKKSKKKTKKLSPYWQAMSDYKKARYKKAKKGLQSLIDNKKIKGNQKARIIHNLGMIAYMDKNYNEAITLFSRLFTEYPEAPYNPNGLLFLGRSFLEAKQTESAKQTLEELIQRFPKKKQAKTAQGILKKLK